MLAQTIEIGMDSQIHRRDVQHHAKRTNMGRSWPLPSPHAETPRTARMCHAWDDRQRACLRALLTPHPQRSGAFGPAFAVSAAKLPGGSDLGESALDRLPRSMPADSRPSVLEERRRTPAGSCSVAHGQSFGAEPWSSHAHPNRKVNVRKCWGFDLSRY